MSFEWRSMAAKLCSGSEIALSVLLVISENFWKAFPKPDLLTDSVVLPTSIWVFDSIGSFVLRELFIFPVWKMCRTEQILSFVVVVIRRMNAIVLQKFGIQFPLKNLKIQNVV